MSFWDFNWVNTLADPMSDQSSWQKGVGLFGSALGDIGAAMQGRPQDQMNLRTFMAQQRSRAGATHVNDLLERLRTLQSPQTAPNDSDVPAHPPSQPQSGFMSAGPDIGMGSDAVAVPTIATHPAAATVQPSLEDLLTQAMQMQARGIDVTPFLSAYQSSRPAKARYRAVVMPDGRLAIYNDSDPMDVKFHGPGSTP
jgi:hypothetical protein